MSRLVDIKSEKFWDVLFDEACVEGSQAERIENDLNKICVSEQEIRNKAIDEFAEKMKELCKGITFAELFIDEIAEQMKAVNDMGKTHERLQGYQTQISIYAEQHRMILASDVLDMIEQLQDDLKDDVDAVVDQLKEISKIYCEEYNQREGSIYLQDVIEIVRKGGVE